MRSFHKGYGVQEENMDVQEEMPAIFQLLWAFFFVLTHVHIQDVYSFH